jgi:peptide deformylase
MAILKIAKMGHPVLLQRAEEIADPLVPAVRTLIADMFETMADADGMGLAAPQVHVPQRLVIFHAPATDGEGDGPHVLINPVITRLSEEMQLGWEGCLSVPGLRGKVPRYQTIRYTGVNAEGKPVDVTAEGMHARVVQHECDHLDGRLYPTQMTDLADLIFESEWRHQVAADSDPDAEAMDDDEEDEDFD